MDFLPVFAMATGMVLLVPHVSRIAAPLVTRVAQAGAVLVVTGGALKAIWKTIVAFGGPDITWLAAAQFPLLGPGFTLLAWAVLAVHPSGGTYGGVTEGADPLTGRAERHGVEGSGVEGNGGEENGVEGSGGEGSGGEENGAGRPAGTPPLWAFAGFAMVGLAAAFAVRATWPLLLVTTVSSTVLAVRLLLMARRAGETVGSFLLGFTIIGTYSMGMLASRPEQTITLQWLEESLNTLIWTSFATAVWRLVRVHARQGGGHARTTSAS
ncbi:hypothetical protein [Microtetraspora glauca]|uniref:Uncharacterized protein n=1 Tax=Microtetraspora glauca TaxID=1996 RepID=A0ABV3GLJ5_MICGL